ncbi:MAG: DNA-3-methyladenine glycosylase I [Simkaniaceae bacterium]|nr:DNA-3-methyladenine glycosylase I [Simkaniaceae bacterium]
MMRCFGDGNPRYEKYHDEEWGVPSHDDRYLFEMLVLEGSQAGLSWETILNKREGYKKAFHNFDPKVVANMSDKELETLRENPDIVRNRLKIYAARKNARIFLEIQREFGTFDAYLWKYVNGKQIVNRTGRVPVTTAISDALSKDLKKRGMTFVGSTIMYAYMQAVGLVNDHRPTCDKYTNLNLNRLS